MIDKTMNQIAKITKEMLYISERHYIQELFDPVQTHAVYGVDVEDVELVKNTLRTFEAKRFRVVKVRDSNLRIVCFKLKLKVTQK